MEISVIGSIDLFAYIDILFTDKVKWKQITDNVKRQHFFMLNRRIAIAFPEIASVVNQNGIDTLAISEMYHAKLCSYKKPRWLYTKTGNEKIDVYENLNVSRENQDIICKLFELERKTFDSLKKRRPEWVLEMCNIIDKSRRSRLTNNESNEY